MKKVSKASFICAIILIVCAIALNVIGFTYLNGVRVYRHVGYGFMQMTYNASSSMTNTCFAMIIAGGFLFVGGILLMMLSAMTCCRCKEKVAEQKDEKKEIALKAAEEVKVEEPKPECCCTEESPSDEKSIEQ